MMDILEKCIWSFWKSVLKILIVIKRYYIVEILKTKLLKKNGED